jgi:hypothetical protein
MALELGSLSLDRLTHIAVAEHARVVRHAVPGLAGELAQVLGRPSVQVQVEGVFFGADAATQLQQLRDLHKAGEPVDFYADAVGEGYFAQVLLQGLHVQQHAGAADEFAYGCTLMEYVEPPEPAVTDMLGGLDAGLLDEAAAFMDDVQNAVAAVADLASLVANLPSFGDPTGALRDMPRAYTQTVGTDLVGTLRDLGG